MTIEIPKLTDRRIEQMLSQMQPVIGFVELGSGEMERNSGGQLYHIEEVNPRNIAYTWSPKVTTRAEGLELLRDITTYHTWAYYGFFKPTIGEVLAQIPEDCIDQVVAFQTLSDDVDIVGDYHRAITRLYTGTPQYNQLSESSPTEQPSEPTKKDPLADYLDPGVERFRRLELD